MAGIGAGLAGRGSRVRKVLRVDRELLARARRCLGSKSDQETVELALDLVVFPRELVAGVRALRGMRL